MNKSLFVLMLFLNNAFIFPQWILHSNVTTLSLMDVHFTDVNNGTLVGIGGLIVKTTNGGSDWSHQLIGDYVILMSVSFHNKTNGIAVGFDWWNDDEGIILRTTDGGITWSHVPSIGRRHYLFNVSFIDSNNCIAVGGIGTILKSTDAGVTWCSQESGTIADLYGIQFFDSNLGIAVGEAGTILKSTNGGITWASQTSGVGGVLYNVNYIDANMAIVVGYDVNGYIGRFLKTTNGGIAWVSHTNISTILPKDVSFIDSNSGTIVGVSGAILKTIDGGLTWDSQYSGTTKSLESISFIDSLNGWIVGNDGTILQTTNGGVSFIRENVSAIPLDYNLSQNYPNPFNPVTKIKYEIPDQARNDNAVVTIKVYDILGREVATLVNEEKPAGEYEVEFNGSNLPSGIYFYRLKAGLFVQTKKMVLIK